MESFQQNGRRFVGGILGDEFVGEGAGEERGRERVHLPLRCSQPRFNLAGRREHRFLSGEEDQAGNQVTVQARSCAILRLVNSTRGSTQCSF